MEIPARLICYGDKGLEYKYCIYKPEKEGESKKGGNPEEKGIYWELYYRNKHSGMRVNRILKLVDKWKDHSMYNIAFICYYISYIIVCLIITLITLYTISNNKDVCVYISDGQSRYKVLTRIAFHDSSCLCGQCR